MNIAISAKNYVADARRDFGKLAVATAAPLSRKQTIFTSGAALMTALVVNASIVFAETELFSKLRTAVESLLTDARSMVSTVATFALVICILGIFIASMFGPKATATMTSALKMVIAFYILWQLTPAILRTIESLFGTGTGSGSGGS